MIIFFKGVIYVVFSLLLGGLLLESVSKSKKPNVIVPKELLLWSIVLVPILMFMFLLQIIQYLSQSIGYWETFTSVLFTFDIGKAWLGSILIAFVLFLLIKNNELHDNTFYARLGSFLTVVLISSYSFASHAASLYPILGFFAHFFHVVAVSAWIGILFYVAWWSNKRTEWIPFLKWYTPFSIGAVLVLSGGGLLLTEIVAPQYIDSWVLNYGQALLIKHLLLIPVLVYAALHGFFLKKSLQKSGTVNVKRSLQGESIIILVVFGVTGFLSMQTPPHEVWTTLLQNAPSPLFLKWFTGTIDEQTVISFAFASDVLLWAVGAVSMLIFTTFSIIKRWPVWTGVLFGLASSGLAYMAMMSGVS
ncbi:copper resistance D family protein [Alkalihalobacillus sp. AL-G]|uniref:copper resistance D family protein n=1 Tax=Alkalihalobacillus sp. AL-G TaxID=2926399 RepID=UPI002729ABFE|nr:CopD family protein [Alkalihalobacillus sp. AL-G]WLD92741.1 CopD family protein [Alkalihalobacillus sp. AL-G]